MESEAIKFVTQALNDYANTLSPSVRGPFIVAANGALMDIKRQIDGANDDIPPAE